MLYYGYKHRWRLPRTLRGSVNIPVQLKPFVPEYKMNLFEIAYLKDEQVKLFKSDFRLVVDYFCQMRKNKKYVPPKDTIKHVYEILSLMSALTNDNRFIDSYEALKKEKRVNMCKVLDEVEAKGIEKGIEKGRDNTLFELVHDGLLDIKETAKRAGKTVGTFRKEMNKMYKMYS